MPSAALEHVILQQLISQMVMRKAKAFHHLVDQRAHMGQWTRDQGQEGERGSDG